MKKGKVVNIEKYNWAFVEWQNALGGPGWESLEEIVETSDDFIILELLSHLEPGIAYVTYRENAFINKRIIGKEGGNQPL